MKGIKWAPRVSPEKIRQLYMDDARRIVNHELLQEVGISFYARAESVIAINRLRTQCVITCPECGKDVAVSSDRQFACECGWEISSDELGRSYKNQQLTGSPPIFVQFAEKFIRDWNQALDNPGKQMAAIDFLIHRFHSEMTAQPTRPVAVNYIDGTMTNVTSLILELAFSDDLAKRKNHDEWLKNKKLAEKVWNK